MKKHRVVIISAIFGFLAFAAIYAIFHSINILIGLTAALIVSYWIVSIKSGLKTRGIINSMKKRSEEE